MINTTYDTGLIIGKFYPLHLGHQFLIDTALSKVNKLTVIVCQNHHYRIPVSIRVGWLKSLYPHINIVVIRHDDHLDSTSVDVSAEWAKIVYKKLKFTPEVVFSSEKYGTYFARYLGTKHILVDVNRIKYSVSGTDIRSNPYKYWNSISIPARAYYATKIVVLGAESTGTTTLAKDLARHYQTIWIPEYGRLYYEAKMYSKYSTKWSSPEFVHIATIQNQMENYYAQYCNRILICDTDSWITRIWHHRYVGKWCPQIDEITGVNKPLYILTDIDIPFVQDGTRDGEHLRQSMHQSFIKELQKHHKNYVVVKGSKKSRLVQAIKAIDIINQNGE